MIPTVNTTKTTARVALLGAMGLAMLSPLAMSGCRGDRTDKPPRRFFPDMDHQPKLKAQSETQFFADGRTMRQPVEGVVAFADHSVLPPQGVDARWALQRSKERADSLKDDGAYYYGLAEGSTQQAPKYVERMPVEVDKDLIARGAERFNIYCSMCHGYDALGQNSGTVGQLLNVRPVNLLDAKYRDHSGEFGSDGYLFHVIRSGLWSPDGSNRMPSYGHAVNERDAWAIVAYIRVLQAAMDPEGNPVASVSTDATGTVASTNSDTNNGDRQ